MEDKIGQKIDINPENFYVIIGVNKPNSLIAIEIPPDHKAKDSRYTLKYNGRYMDSLPCFSIGEKDELNHRIVLLEPDSKMRREWKSFFNYTFELFSEEEFRDLYFQFHDVKSGDIDDKVQVYCTRDTSANMYMILQKVLS